MDDGMWNLKRLSVFCIVLFSIPFEHNILIIHSFICYVLLSMDAGQ